MSAEVKAALEAAASALRDAASDPSLGEEEASAAIAAFLRALPYHLILADTGGRPVCSGAHWLAAAVEAERE